MDSIGGGDQCVIVAEVLPLVESAFPLVPRPAVAELSAHTDGCAHCEMTTQYLAGHPGPGLSAEAIRWLCDEIWVLPWYLRYVLTAENPRNPRPTEFLIYNLAPAAEHAAEAREQLSLLTGEQVEVLRAVVRHLAATPYWADYCGEYLHRAESFLRELPGHSPQGPDAKPHK